jgi:glucosamine 6-phosphate synthetase-like amidotransferase/phosphosugar isomerase protein
VRAAFAELRGHYAFVAMHADHPDELIGARKECPLVAGIGEGEAYLASSIAAFLADTRTAMPIENGEIISISAAGVAITTAAGEPVSREPETVTCRRHQPVLRDRRRHPGGCASGSGGRRDRGSAGRLQSRAGR